MALLRHFPIDFKYILQLTPFNAETLNVKSVAVGKAPSFSPEETQLPSTASLETSRNPLVPDFASIGKNRPDGKVLLPKDLHLMRRLLHEMFTARAAISPPSSLTSRRYCSMFGCKSEYDHASLFSFQMIGSNCAEQFWNTGLRGRWQ